MIRLALLATLLATLSACRATGEFVCATDDQCRHGREIGWCEAAGNCTFTDTSCASQRRYDDNSREAVAGECLDGVVTGSIREQYFINDDMARPIVRERLIPEGELKPTVSFEDGSTQTVTYRELDGTFSLPNPDGQHYQLAYQVDGAGRAIQHAAPHLELVVRTAGRRDRDMVTRPTTLTFAQTPSLTGSVWITSTGLWTYTITGSGSNAQINWLTAQSLSGKLGLLDGTKHDRVYYLLTGLVLGYTTITAHASYEVTQVDGVPMTASGPLATVTNRDLCVNVAHLAQTELNRRKSVFPSVTGGSSAWSIEALPGRDITPSFGHKLALGNTSPPTDATTAIRYINPYPGTSTIATMSTAMQVSIGYMTNAGASLPLDTVATVAVDPTDASCSTQAMLSTTAALDGEIRVGNTAIDADNKACTLMGNKPNTVVTWTPRAAGPAHVYVALLYELSDDGAGGTTAELRGAWETAEARVMIPTSLLQAGHEYVLGLWTFLGAPNAAAGDYLTVSYPYEQSTSYSRTFVIN